MSSKQREALEKCDALLKRITESAWFIEASIGTTKDVMDVGNAITEALSIPLRNCEIGTAEEQFKRHSKWCATTRDFSCADTMCRKCFADWAQMPYEKEGEA